jgi:aspartyl/asparaginyl-tRNA synthetase
MQQSEDGKSAKKIDVILHGIETIGSAERSCDKEEMRRQFETISGGTYANTLYSQFGKERVQKEMDDFLSHDFFPRCGGGIGVTRMIRAMKLSGLLPTFSKTTPKTLNLD